MAGDHNMKLDGAKTPSGWLSRFWLAVKRGFGALPRMYWWYAVACIVSFSVAWPTGISPVISTSSPSGDLGSVEFGFPFTYGNTDAYWLYPHEFDPPEEVFGHERYKPSPVMVVMCNLLFWCGVFLLPVIMVAMAKWRQRDWEHASAVGWRSVVIVLCLVMLHEPMEILLQIIVRQWGSAGSNSFVHGILPSAVDIQQVCLGLVVWILAVGMAARFWRVCPLFSRWLCIAIMVTAVFVSDSIRGMVKQAQMEITLAVILLFLLDGVVVLLRWWTRQRRMPVKQT